jgi:hypothetical protein
MARKLHLRMEKIGRYFSAKKQPLAEFSWAKM